MALPKDFDAHQTHLKLGIAHSVKDVAFALRMKPGGLFHILQNTEDGNYYRTFQVPKKNCGLREIDQPVRGLSMAQERLAPVLQSVYRPRPFVHGYVKGRSFLSNARYHENQRWVLNIDIEDFFGSINFGRVRGVLLSSLFGYNVRVATILARLCTYRGRLPQGARTSPVLANIIAHNLDRELVAIAAKENLRFSRYADDITFSASQKRPPRSLIKSWNPEYGMREVELGERVKAAFKEASFTINDDKTRIQLFGERQVVTGLIVNQKANVRRADIKRLRMKLYSAKKFGIESASTVWCGHNSSASDFLAHIEGWLGHIRQVRGREDPVLSKLCKQAIDAIPTLSNWVRETANMVHEFDIFLSHASEDKPKVKLLLDKLEGLGIRVFFDETSIQWGDSIVEKINFGLATSNFFVPFLSNTFSEKGWTNKELNSAIATNIDRKGRILPICDIGFHVGENYPLLADILYKSWPEDEETQEQSLAALADELLAIVEKHKQTIA